jgi:hypothetical protein
MNNEQTDPMQQSATCGVCGISEGSYFSQQPTVLATHNYPVNIATRPVVHVVQMYTDSARVWPTAGCTGAHRKLGARVCVCACGLIARKRNERPYKCPGGAVNSQPPLAPFA